MISSTTLTYEKCTYHVGKPVKDKIFSLPHNLPTHSGAQARFS